MNGLIENTELWTTFQLVCSRAQHGETLSTSVLDDATILLAACILYKNWQRLGALTNATLQQRAKLLVKGKGIPNPI